jgi:hypothetical protein
MEMLRTTAVRAAKLSPSLALTDEIIAMANSLTTSSVRGGVEDWCHSGIIDSTKNASFEVGFLLP